MEDMHVCMSVIASRRESQYLKFTETRPTGVALEVPKDGEVNSQNNLEGCSEMSLYQAWRFDADFL